MSGTKRPAASLTDAEAASFVRTRTGERKFIGGAAMARLNANRRPPSAATTLTTTTKRKTATRILRPDEVQKSKQTVPTGLPSFETFFAGLLRSEATEYLPVGNPRGGGKLPTDGGQGTTLNTICQRLSLPTPVQPLASSYSTIRDHFSSRAALVMEEARYAIAEGVRGLKEDLDRRRVASASVGKNSGNRIRNKNGSRNLESPPASDSGTMVLKLTGVEHKERSGHSILTFLKEGGPFTRDQTQALRHGTVLACHDRRLAPNVSNSILACVIPQSREDMATLQSFAVMVYKTIKKSSGGVWDLTPITSLLSEQRKFEACTSQMMAPVSFIFPLLGGKEASHVKFHEDENGDTYAVDARRRDGADGGNDDDDDSDSDSDCQLLEVETLENAFVLPRLNAMQETAARSFLGAKKDTITLIQGPPGTGKTTLLVSVVCRYIIESRKLQRTKRCLMVCAPTNKAITVLCSRFLDAMKGDVLPCNVVLVGDDDKLLEDGGERSSREGERSRLRSIFLYTFTDMLQEDYLLIRNVLVQNDFRALQKVRNIAHRLDVRLKSNISDKTVLDLSERIVRQIDDAAKRTKVPLSEAISSVDLILTMIGEWKRERIWHEVVHGADVIFCTLASSGASFLRKAVREVDDLIVDEAAAATEPELYIPFQFLPRRLLAVGDPKQLPATVASRVADQLGLSKSLHERLMYDCGYRHIMLDTQYRMKPELSQFPSEQFYEARLKNGPNVVRPEYNGGISMMGCSEYALCEIDGPERQARSGSYENESEAQAVVKIVEDFRQSSRAFAGAWCSPDRLRIITFYQAQVALIKRLLLQHNLGGVLVATVDSSQGCEADFVIVSFVRSQGRSNRNTVGFLTDDRRMNVAMTRAKYQLLCVGNVKRMAGLTDKRAETVKRLALDAIKRQRTIAFPPGGFLSRKQPVASNSSQIVTNRQPPPGVRQGRVQQPLLSQMVTNRQPPPGVRQGRVQQPLLSLNNEVDSRKRSVPEDVEPRKRRLAISQPLQTFEPVTNNPSLEPDTLHRVENRALSTFTGGSPSSSSCSSSCSSPSSSSCSSSCSSPSSSSGSSSDSSVESPSDDGNNDGVPPTKRKNFINNRGISRDDHRTGVYHPEFDDAATDVSPSDVKEFKHGVAETNSFTTGDGGLSSGDSYKIGSQNDEVTEPLLQNTASPDRPEPAGLFEEFRF